MDDGDTEIVGPIVETKCADTNTNSNNVISEQDVKISFGFEESADEPPVVFEDSATDKEVVKDEGKEEDESRKKMEAERQEWMHKVEEERSQWDALEDVQRTSTGSIKTTPAVSFSESLDHFQSKSLDTSSINPTVRRTGLAALLHFLFGPPKLHHSLIEERNLIFCIAQVQLDDGEEMHGRVLQTIFKKLTGSKFDCPRRGSHWETIGFQGNDPATDLRGVGFLGLLQILYAVTNSELSSLFTDFYRLSIDEEQNFPFCVMSFNVTRIAMQVMREEKLHRECNRRKQVIAVLNDFYVAVFLHIYTIWKTQFKTMKESGHVIQDAEKQARKNPRILLRNFETVLKERSANRRKLPASPVPITGPLMSDQPPGVHRKLSAASSLSSETEKKNFSNQSLNESTENSARFVQTKKSSTDNLQYFTDIRLEVKDEPVTDL